MKDNWITYGVLTAALGLGACSSPEQKERPEDILAREFGEDANAFAPDPNYVPAAPVGEMAPPAVVVADPTQPGIEVERAGQPDHGTVTAPVVIAELPHSEPVVKSEAPNAEPVVETEALDAEPVVKTEAPNAEPMVETATPEVTKAKPQIEPATQPDITVLRPGQSGNVREPEPKPQVENVVLTEAPSTDPKVETVASTGPVDPPVENVTETAKQFGDKTQAILDALVRGQTEVRYYFAIHRDTVAGQFADHGQYRLSVVGHMNGLPLVEQSFEGYTIAYLIDPESRHYRDDVLRAWVGRTGQAPTEVTVPYPDNAKTKTQAMKREPFAGLFIMGKVYEGYIETPKFDSAKARYWKSPLLPFDGMIRKQVDGEMINVRYGTGDPARLDWSGFKFDPRH